MKIIKQHRYFLSLAIILGFVLTFSSCKKDKPLLNASVITNLEVGSGDSKSATAGSDLHIEAQIIAEEGIKEIEIDIHGEGGISYTINQKYTEGRYIGAKNIEFHEHIDIPQDAPAGSYHLHFIVKDNKGQRTEVDSDLTIGQKVRRAELTFTKLTGGQAEAHGDHFHGLGDATEGESVSVAFDEKGTATQNGHLHLEADAIYKVVLKAWDYRDEEIQHGFIANKSVADQYKAFLIGGDFKLNTESLTEEGAIFQPREQTYADGSAVDGQYETTGILSYFTIGHENEGPTREVVYVLRKLNEGVKAQITRTDWNRNDYQSAFSGSNILELKFEIHAEHGHHH